MLLSIVIPAFNEAEGLEETIKRIQFALEENADKAFSWEIIVCDNNSTDQTAAVAARAGATVVFEEQNQISIARNKGAEIAEGEWLLFIDADTYPPPELIADVLELITSATCVGCGATVEVENGTLFNKLRMERLNPLFRLFNLCGGAFLLCERSAFEMIRGFSLDLYAYEEIDFVLRLKRHGRQKRKKFHVLYEHPVITSGRKGEYRLSRITALLVSNFAAVILFGLHYLLPGKVIKKLGSRMLGYWYDNRK